MVQGKQETSTVMIIQLIPASLVKLEAGKKNLKSHY